MSLKYSKMSDNATAPTKATEFAAGFDLYSAHDYCVPSRGRLLVLTDIKVALPENCYGRIAPRSGLALKHGIDVGAGVIDKDYRGNVGVVLFNFGSKDYKVKKGDAVAQLICELILYPVLEECQVTIFLLIIV